MAAKKPAKRRTLRPDLLMTPEQCFQAGWADGERLKERMTPRQRERLIILLRPYLGPDARRRTEPA